MGGGGIKGYSIFFIQKCLNRKTSVYNLTKESGLRINKLENMNTKTKNSLIA